MDNNREELKQLIEKENVVDKVCKLIDLKYNFYTDNQTEKSRSILNALSVMRAELNSSNALVILEMLLDGDFTDRSEYEIRQSIEEANSY